MGVADSDTEMHIVTHRAISMQATQDMLTWFWELEELPTASLRSPDDEKCYQHFVSTHSRNDEGRYVVRLPFKQIPTLGDTLPVAAASYRKLERRLSKDPQLAEAYESFLNEYSTSATCTYCLVTRLRLHQIAATSLIIQYWNKETSLKSGLYLTHHRSSLKISRWISFYIKVPNFKSTYWLCWFDGHSSDTYLLAM